MKKILIGLAMFSLFAILSVVGAAAAPVASPIDISGFEMLGFIIGAFFAVLLPVALLLFFYDKILDLLGGAGNFLRGLTRM